MVASFRERFQDIKAKLKDAIEKDTRHTTLKETNVKEKKEGRPFSSFYLGTDLFIVVED